LWPGPLDETCPQAAFPSQPLLEAGHLASVALVVVAEEMEQPVQRQHSQFGQLGVSRFARLPSGDPTRDYDLT
jgi:hypothetical protein